MTTAFPASLDDFTNPDADTDDLDTTGVEHDEQHANANDAIEALQAKVGIDSSVVTASLDYLLKSTSSLDPGHKHSKAESALQAADIGVSIQAYDADLTAWAGKTAPSGAAVGDSDTQTLTNKDLSSGTNTFPTFNQNTTGSAATLTTPRAIYGNNFDGSAALTQVIASTYGGTGNGFAKLSGPASTEKTFTLPNASATILTDNAVVTAAQGGTGQSSYAVGDILYASGSTALSNLADVAAGSYLRSGGVTTAPLWSTLILPNAATSTRVPYATGTNTWGDSANLTFDGSILNVNTLNGVGMSANSSGVNTSAGFRAQVSGGGGTGLAYFEWRMTGDTSTFTMQRNNSGTPANDVLSTKWGSTTLSSMTTAGAIIFSSTVDAVTGYKVNGAATSGKILIGNGTSFVASTPTFPNASATSLKHIRSDGTNWIASTSTYSDTPSTALKWLRSDGTNWITSTSTLSDSPSTAGKIVVSDGTNWITSTPTFPNASATSGKFIRSDGTNWIASTPTLPTAAGSAGTFLRSDGTNFLTSGTTIPDTGTSGGIPYYSSTSALTSSAALTSNAIVKGGGAGAAPVASGVTLDSSNNIAGYGATINAQSGTTYTLVAGDAGKVVECSNASAITLTLPNSLAAGFCCTIVQTGAGQVTLAAGAGATIRTPASFTKTNGQWSMLTVYVTTNAGGSSAIYVIGGNGSVFAIPLLIRNAKLPTAVTAATLDGGQNRDYLLFDDATAWFAEWQFMMPFTYNTNMTATAKLTWTAASATSGSVVWNAAVMATTPSDAATLETDSFDTVNATTTATNATAAGRVNTTSITLTNKDSMDAGDIVSLRISRNASNGSDTMTGNAQLAGIVLEFS